MKARILLTGILFTLSTAQADSLQLHGLSWHSENRANGMKWNERNYGVGYRKELSDDFRVQGGVYKNSTNRTTAYIITDYTPLNLGMVSAGVFAGLGTGYSKPFLGGGVVDIGRLSFRLIPKTKSNPFTIGIEYGIPL